MYVKQEKQSFPRSHIKDYVFILTLHQFCDIDTELDLTELRVVSMEHLQRV